MDKNIIQKVLKKWGEKINVQILKTNLIYILQNIKKLVLNLK